MSLAELAQRATEFDRVAPFNEATLLALAAGDEPRVDVRLEAPGDVLIAAAVAYGAAPVELVVDPRFRRGGLGRRLLEEVRGTGEERFWAHGDLSDARRLAASAGLQSTRTLLRLRREGPPPQAAGTDVRPFAEADVDRILEINATAFADHPEQGAMEGADFARRRSADWFDPAGLLVLETDGEIVGFHWTKIENGAGEVYVVAVDSHHAGKGHGATLLAAGLQHLAGRGVTSVDLYVEADNPAVALYERFGFTEHGRDVLYASP